MPYMVKAKAFGGFYKWVYSSMISARYPIFFREWMRSSVSTFSPSTVKILSGFSVSTCQWVTCSLASKTGVTLATQEPQLHF